MKIFLGDCERSTRFREKSDVLVKALNKAGYSVQLTKSTGKEDLDWSVIITKTVRFNLLQMVEAIELQGFNVEKVDFSDDLTSVTVYMHLGGERTPCFLTERVRTVTKHALSEKMREKCVSASQ